MPEPNLPPIEQRMKTPGGIEAQELAGQSKIPPGCICLGDGLFGMHCDAKEHACMNCGGTGEERSGSCHCGTSLNLHSVYENHTAVEMTRTCEACGGTGKREVPNA